MFLSRNRDAGLLHTLHPIEMNLRFLPCSVDIFTSALYTTAHMLVYTDITYILLLDMDNSFGTMPGFRDLSEKLGSMAKILSTRFT